MMSYAEVPDCPSVLLRCQKPRVKSVEYGIRFRPAAFVVAEPVLTLGPSTTTGLYVAYPHVDALS